MQIESNDPRDRSLSALSHVQALVDDYLRQSMRVRLLEQALEEKNEEIHALRGNQAVSEDG